MGLQEQISSLAEGASFTAEPQTHTGDLIIPKARLKLTLAGVIVNGGIRRAHDGVTGVVIEGVTSRGYNGPAPYQNEQAAIRPWHDWILDGCIAENGNGTGIAASAPTGQFVRNVVMRGCISRGNGRNGIGAARYQGLQVLNCQTNGNNTRKFNPGDEGGGGKYSVGDGLVIDGLKTWDNWGVGLWLDYQNKNYVVKNSEAWGNKNVANSWEGSGFNTEINEGPGLFENCYAHDNAARGFNIWESMGVTVSNCRAPGDDGLEFRDLTGRSPYRVYDIRLENFQGPIFYSINMSASQHAAKKIVITTGTTPTPEPQPVPVEPSWKPAGSVAISDLVIEGPLNWWGKMEKDRSNGEQGDNDGKTLTMAGVQYPKGLGMHADAGGRINLAGKYERIVGRFGIDDEVGNNGSATLQLTVDGQIKFASPVAKGSDAALMAFDVPLTGAQSLMFEALATADGKNYDHCDLIAYLVPTVVPVPPPAPVVEDVTFTKTVTFKAGLRDGKIVEVA